ncbi:MAG TPA: hypothetical protein VHL09_13045 [Dehalococcoidia bacterium]|nr:hypothetical protein [Dehalococcoidia bacterium]
MRVENRQDGDLRMDGSADLNRIFGSEVSPANVAYAESSCANCQTFAVALQIVVYRRGAQTVSPQNIGRAINQDCTRCITIARAVQYVIPVDNPREVPGNVRRLVRTMDRELNAIRRDRNISPAEANRRISAVVAEFRELGEYLRDQTDEATELTSPSVTPGASPLPSATATSATEETPATGETPASTTPSVIPGPSPMPSVARTLAIEAPATSSVSKQATVWPAVSPVASPVAIRTP